MWKFKLPRLLGSCLRKRQLVVGFKKTLPLFFAQILNRELLSHLPMKEKVPQRSSFARIAICGSKFEEKKGDRFPIESND